MSDGSLARIPVVTLAVAAVIAVVFAAVQLGAGGGDGSAEKALSRARTFYQQNPQVKVSRRNTELLGREFVSGVAEEYVARSAHSRGPIFSARMQYRTQEKFQRLADEAFDAKLVAFPAWRFGVSPVAASPLNYFAHAFVHESALALGLSLAFLILAGMGLEGAMGSLLFAGLCALGVLAPGIAYRVFDGGTGIPFSGAGGLVAVLLGAYGVRSFKGDMSLPGWMLVPVWFFAEYFFVREIWVENLRSAPFITHAFALGFGAACALGMEAIGLEKTLADRSYTHAAGTNPAIGLARLAMDQGRAAEALAILAEAHGESPADTDLALAYWERAREMGRAAAAASAIMPVIRDDLRKGVVERACLHWRELVGVVPDTTAEPTLLLRLGEALLDEGHPDAAVDALERAVRHGTDLSSALAQRVVRIARDLDPDLTARAVAIALADRQLDPATREDFEQLGSDVVMSPPDLFAGANAATPQGEGPNAATESATPTTSTTPAMPADTVANDAADPSAIDLDNTEELTDPGEFEALSVATPADGRSVETNIEDLDPDALSLHSIDDEFSGELGLDPAEVTGEDITEDWNQPDTLDASVFLDGETAPTLADAGAGGGAQIDNSHLEAGALSTEALSAHADLPSLEPMAADLPATDQSSVNHSTDDEASEAPGEVDDDVTDLSALDDLDFTIGEARRLDVTLGTPLACSATGIEIELEGSGKRTVDFDEIDAVAVAAVAGLSAKPVLVIDLVLNWMLQSGEPLHVIRLASHRFNPKRLFPEATSPLDGIKTLVARVMAESGATPLPDRGAALGEPFVHHPDIESFEREVLMTGE